VKKLEEVFPKMDMMVEGIKKGSVIPALKWEQKFQHGYPQLELGILDHYYKPWGVLLPVLNPFPVEFNLRMHGSDGKDILIPQGSLFSVFSADTGEVELENIEDFVPIWEKKKKEEESVFEGWLPLCFYDNESLIPSSYHRGVLCRYSYKILYYMPSLAKIIFI
jgi:hypothetical protein